MSSEMIERVARVLQPGYDDTSGCQCGSCRVSHARDQKVARLNARAVIEAMREPTEAMLDAGEFTSPNIVSPSFARELFTTMIDAALK